MLDVAHVSAFLAELANSESLKSSCPWPVKVQGLRPQGSRAGQGAAIVCCTSPYALAESRRIRTAYDSETLNP